ncbi:hypothetical protein CHS0354_034011 [Potamilus streckersoni]|uniref:Mitochondrial cytochrome c oxidase subunit Vb n=1 Tax=Potamilus streckersoni TaxID=2493646 RepID=A0AAE0RMU5_9BIVA|nr:hypothetical protein CHS0354_034011 [Potamilus streckersoni]
MASRLCQLGVRLIRQPILLSHVRASSAAHRPPVNQHEGKIAVETASMPDGLGHAVGLERQELLMKLSGNEDPFEMKVTKIPTDNKRTNPITVFCMDPSRMVGCVCEEDALYINWMLIHRGEKRRCECGYWFQGVAYDEGGSSHH